MQDDYNIGIALEPPPESRTVRDCLKLIFNSFAHPVKTIRTAYTDYDLTAFIIGLILFWMIFSLSLIMSVLLPDNPNMNENIWIIILVLGLLVPLGSIFHIPLFLLAPLLNFLIVFILGIAIPEFIRALTRKGGIMERFDADMEPPPEKVFTALVTTATPAMLIYALLLLLINSFIVILHYSGAPYEILIQNTADFRLNFLPMIYVTIYTVWLFFAFRAFGLRIWLCILSLIPILVINLYCASRVKSFLVTTLEIILND